MHRAATSAPKSRFASSDGDNLGPLLCFVTLGNSSAFMLFGFSRLLFTVLLTLTVAIALRSRLFSRFTSASTPFLSTANTSRTMSAAPQHPQEWRAALEALPSLGETQGRIPSFFIAHGSPSLIHPKPVPAGLVARIGQDASAGGRQEAVRSPLSSSSGIELRRSAVLERSRQNIDR